MKVKPLTRVDADRMPHQQVSYLMGHGFRAERGRGGRLYLARTHRKSQEKMVGIAMRVWRAFTYIVISAFLLSAYFVASGF